jgi:hypothetical protein
VRPKTSIACAAAALLCGPPAAASAAADAARYSSTALVSATASVPAGTGLHVIQTVRSPFTFDLAGARWRAHGTVHVLLRTRTVHGRWSSWAETGAADPDGAEDRAPGVSHGEPVWAKGSRYVQVAVRGPGTVSDLHVAFVDGTRGPATKPRPFALQAAAAAGTAPPIITRAQWGANEAIRRAAPSYAPSVSVIFVHHTATPNGYAAADSAAIVRSIYTYHVKSNGWNDIGYNYLVDAYGQVFEGRYGGLDKNVIGAQTLGFNTGSAGIAVIGNGQTKGLTDAARTALISLISWRLDLAHIDPRSKQTLISGGNPSHAAGQAVAFRAVSGHRDGYTTECPGNLIYAELDSLAAQAAVTGLPKIYGITVTPPTLQLQPDGRIAPVTFAATAAGAVTWTVRVLDTTGATVASGSGSGQTVTWTWSAGAIAPKNIAGYRIEATAADGRQALAASGTFGPGSTPPPPSGDGPLAVDARPRAISPNGDGTADLATVRYHLASASIVTANVLDPSGAVVATPLPPTSLPAGDHSIPWNGFGRDGVTPVPDGYYHVVVQSTDSTGRTQTGVAQIGVARAFAAVQVGRAVSSPNADGRFDRVPILWRQDEAAQVSVSIMHRDQLVAQVFDGPLGPGPAQAVWDGASSEELRSGPYLVVVRAQTAGGEQVLARRLKLDLAPPRIKVLQASTWYGGGSVRILLNEAAYVQIVAGKRKVVPFAPRPPGLNGFGWHVPNKASRIRIYAWDLVGNRMQPLTIYPKKKPKL